MTARTRAADDFDVIRRRRVEIDLEQRKAAAGEGCRCKVGSGEHGPFLDAADCDLHRPQAVAA